MNRRDEEEIRDELAKMRSKLAGAQRDARRYGRRVAQLADILETDQPRREVRRLRRVV